MDVTRFIPLFKGPLGLLEPISVVSLSEGRVHPERVARSDITSIPSLCEVKQHISEFTFASDVTYTDMHLNIIISKSSIFCPSNPKNEVSEYLHPGKLF